MRRPGFRALVHSRPLFLVACVLAGLGIAGGIMATCGYPVGAAYGALWTGATGIQGGAANGPSQIGLLIAGRPVHLHLFLLAQSLARATPLILTGLAVAVGLRSGLFNIGAQGQMVLGALGAAVAGQARGLPAALHIPLVLCTGAFVGALWGSIPAVLKARRGVHEVLSTILLNYVAVNLAAYLILHGLKDPARMAPETREIAASAWLRTASFAPQSNLTGGFLLAIMAALCFAALLPRTAWGYRLRATGLGPEAAEASGIRANRTRTFAMALSGALAGAAGAIEVMSVHHRYVEGVAATYGFDGIAVALLGGLSGAGVLVSALFFGALQSGAAFMESQTSVPADLAIIVQGIVILFAGVRLFRNEPARESIQEERGAPMSLADLGQARLVLALATATLAGATPLTLAAMGGILSERAGIVNIALEGFMVTGAFVAVFAGRSSGGEGLAVAALAGALFGLLHGVLTQKLKVDHVVSGLGINLLAAGATRFLALRWFPTGGITVAGVPSSFFLGLAVTLAFVVHFALGRTRFGLRLRAVGENPETARMAGIDPLPLRYAAAGLCGMLGALAGAYLSLGESHTFSSNMSAGKGYIALAAVIFGKWKPAGAALAALLFGFCYALQSQLQISGMHLQWIGIEWSSPALLDMLPYLMTLLALVTVVGRATPPAALGKEI